MKGVRGLRGVTQFIGVLFAVCLFALAGPAFAAGKSELSLIGEYLQTDTDGPNPWTANLELLFGSSHIVFGPSAAIGQDDDLNRLGGALEWNIGGQKHLTPFIGAQALYFMRQVEGEERYTLAGRAGFKVPVGTGAAIKIYAFQLLDGRGAAESDLGVAAGIIARF